MGLQGLRRDRHPPLASGKKLIGDYTFSGGGTLDVKWGDTATFHYKDGTAEGKGWGTLAPNDLTFAGQLSDAEISALAAYVTGG